MPADPDWTKAVIPPEKLIDYLLALDHPEGGPKATFFVRCGFDPTQPAVLEAALKAQAVAANISSTEGTYGIKYVADGPMIGPDGVSRRLRTVWIVEATDLGPRFVTAYPLEKLDGDL